MKIGISYVASESIFDSSKGQQILTLATVCQRAGHSVLLLNQGQQDWWMDEKVLKGTFERVLMKDFAERSPEQLDLFIDVDGICLGSVRTKIAKRVAVLFRGSPDYTFLEKATYIETNPLYTLEGAHEIWVWDAFVQESRIPMLQSLLEGLPVRRVPYVWIEDFVSQQKDIPVGSQRPTTVLIAEKNTTNTSSCIVPLIAATKWKKTSAVRIVNGKSMESDKFFQKNIRDNCLLTVPLTYEDRSPCVDWANTTVITHTRFTPFRPLFLDLLWLGIPFVHNCPALRESGAPYYCETDLIDLVKCLETPGPDRAVTRAWVTNQWSIEKGLPLWTDILATGVRRKGGASLSATAVTAVTAATVIPTTSITSVTAITVGFSDMWEGFDPTDNFFLDLLKQYTTVKGVSVTAATATTIESINLLLCGPFGTVWQAVSPSIPKVYFSGERTRPGETSDPRISLYLTHELVEDSRHIRFPIWQLFLDWFGTAKPQRNPNGLPVVSATTGSSFVKPHFCAFVVSNPTNLERNNAFKKLNTYKPVRSGGQYKNNIGGPISALYGGGGGGDTAKHEFLKQHTFCICYENSVADGYVTEKLLHAKMAGCIPLYGGCDAALDFDPSGYIHVKPGDDIVTLVKELEADPVHLAAMAAVPALSPLGFRNAKAMLDRVGSALVALAGIRVPLFCSFATAAYLPSLEQNLQGVSMLRQKTRQPLGFVAYLGLDVASESQESLCRKFPWATFRKIPSVSPVPGFSDFLEPGLFGWKLWILKELCEEGAFRGRPILYTDAAAIWLKLPEEILSVIKEKGVCMTLDEIQHNRSWCSPAMVKSMGVTESELSENQILGAFLGFEAGHPAATRLFEEAFVWGSKRDCLVGSHLNHRHDQSIFSILRLRHRIDTVKGGRLVCAMSMRKTHQKGLSVYHHRNAFTVHKHVFTGIDDVWMVSLDRRADRWDSWKAACSELATVTNRLPAVDGKLLELTQNLYTFFERNNFNSKKSVAGCALSHILLWAQLASEQPFVKNYLILEDDQRFIGADWQQRLKVAMSTAPTDAELLYLGGVLPGNLSFYSSCLNPVNDVWATIKPNSYFTGNKVLAPVFHFCTYAYVLTRAGAQKLCQTLTRNGCLTSIDHYLMGAGLKTYVLRDLLATCYQIDDPKYKESEFDNFDRIDQFDSDIWNNKDCFVDNGDFVKDLEYPPLYQVVVDVLTQAPHSIQTRNTIRPDLGFKQPIGNSKIVYYFNRTDGQPHDGTLEEGWLRTLWPDFTFRSITEPFVPGSWILVARPNMDFWAKKAIELDGKGVPFQVLHLSDEFVEDPIDLYRLGCCRQVVRNYWRPDCASSPKVVTIPLGFARGVSKNRTVGGLLKDRPYVWSFHGTNWFGRKQLLEPLMNVVPHSCKWLPEFMDSKTITPAKEYQKLLLETQFVPVPAGNNPETYRIYEALENGCIPVYVRSEGDDVFWTWICRWLPLHPLASWTEAMAWMNTVHQEEYRGRLLDAWASWKTIAKLGFQL